MLARSMQLGARQPSGRAVARVQLEHQRHQDRRAGGTIVRGSPRGPQRAGNYAGLARVRHSGSQQKAPQVIEWE